MAASVSPRNSPGDPSLHPTEPELLPPRPPRRRWRWLALGLALLVAAVSLRALVGRAPIRTKLLALMQAKLPGLKLVGDARFDWLGRLELGPLEWNGEDGRPELTIDRVKVRPSYRALLRGRVEPASVRMGTVVIDAGRDGERLRALLAALRGRPHRRGGGKPTPWPYLRVDRLELSGVDAGGAAISVAAEDLRVKALRDDGLQVEARAELPGGGRVSLELNRPSGAPLALVAKLDGAGPASLPPWLAARLPFRIDEGRFSARLETISSGLRRGALRLSAAADGLTLEGERLADAPVGPLRVALKGDLRWDAPRLRIILEDGTLALGPDGQLGIELSADLQLSGDPRLSASATVDSLAFPRALEALPASLQPPPEAPKVQGALSAAVSLEGPLRKPDAWKLTAKLDLSKLKPVDPRNLALAAPFRYDTADGAGQAHGFLVGPKNPDFVPLAELPVFVWRAVTTSEDAGFFAHKGFDFDELKNSIVADELAGRAVRGGSTITQQLAKNLYLSKEKTYARKLREALATVGLEASYTKQRLLEIYLNVIEWGPGIYGIGPAARHYFGKDARALTPKEAAFLATIIPNPIRFSIYYERGALTESWEARLDDLLNKMHDLGYLTDDQHLDAVMLPLAFARPSPDPGVTAARPSP